MRPPSLYIQTLTAALLALVFVVPSAKAGDDLPRLTISVLQFGTAHWELDHLSHRRLDRAEGFVLQVQTVANLSASRLAVASGGANGAVADLLWVQARHGAGDAYLFVPFSTRIGEILVAEDSGIHQVSDLVGKRIGVAGGPDSKGWILLQEVARRQGLDLAQRAEVQYAAPPLLSQSLKRGDLDAIVTYWHFGARLIGEGEWRTAFSMADLLADLGFERPLPVLGYVFPEPWATENRNLIDRFSRSLRAAKMELAAKPAYWQRLRRLMQSPTDGELAALSRGFLAGTPEPLSPPLLEDLARLLAITGKPGSAPLPVGRLYQEAP